MSTRIVLTALAVVLALALLNACTRGPAPAPSASPEVMRSSGPYAPPRYEATIRRTAHGVPHIEAADLGSLGFGEGYAQAEDHVCTIAAQILMARGEQAKYLGPGDGNAYVMTDVVLRAVGFPERGWAFLTRQPPETRAWLEGFAAGYNRYLAASAPEEHPEWCRGAEWVARIEPRDLAAYVHLATLHTPLVARQILQARPPEQGTAGPTRPEGGATLAEPAGLFEGGAGASNGWAVGRDLSASGRGMLVANPHVAWTGSLRMWEKHLSIPGELDVYGVNRIGLPGVLIGFNEHVAWTHTVSPAAYRTLHALELIPGEPTRYRYGDEVREMTAREVEVEVRDLPEPVRRTVWLSDRGPIVGAPPFEWTVERAYAIRDVNDDDRATPLLHLLGTARARSLDELRQVHREHQPFTRLHTLATDASGEVWYVDSSAVPHLSPEALEAWRARAEEDSLVRRMAESGTIVLDGSDPLFDAVDDPEAARPGIVPFGALPELRRTDYVFNANDSHWAVHGEVRLEGSYSPFLNGGAGILIPRSRNNALHLEDRVPGRTFRTDGRFTFEGLQAAILSERSLTADLLVPELVQRCRTTPHVVLHDTGPVDLGPACGVLERWDRDFGLESRGAVLYREWMSEYEWEDYLGAGRLFAVDFDPRDPLGTPRGLAPGPLALENLARAGRRLERQGLPLDIELGAVQYAGSKLPSRIPVPGATHREGGLSNTSFNIRPPTHEPVELPPGVPGSRYLTENGYPVLSSHGLLLVVEFTDAGPRAEAILTGGQSGNPDSKHFRDQTELYSRGEWRPVLFRAEEVRAGAVREYTVEGSVAGGPEAQAPVLSRLDELDDGWNTLEPGGRTSCAHGDPFAFHVRPGDPARVLLYLTGGGGCSDAEGCQEGSNRYTQRMRPDGLAGVGGILDLAHPENPFREHTMVMVQVCTGDVHLGDRDEVYVLEGAGGARREFTVRHRGMVNGMAALDWMAENLPEPAEVFVAGGSAGAVATPVYASLLARRHPEARVAGLSDDAGSYIAGTMPLTDTRRWGMADALAAHAGWEDFPEGLATDRLLVAAAQGLPNLRLYQLDHAHDRVQVFFQEVPGNPEPDLPALLRQARERIRSQVPTHRAFTLGGHLHQSLHLPTFYVLAQDGYRLRDWVAAVAAGDEVPDVACSDCQGPEFVLEPQDLRVLEGTLGLLGEDGAWEPDSSRGCPTEEGRFSLGCALGTEVSRVSEDPLSSGAVLAVLYATAARVPYDRDGWNPFRGFNDEVAASVDDVRALLQGVLERARSGGARPGIGATRDRLPRAGYEDFRESAGRLEGGVLKISLEAKAAEWRPWGVDGPAVFTHVFAADGEAPRVPGPLIRVRAGTSVHVTVRNNLPDTLAVRGLRDHGDGVPAFPTVIAEQIVVEPGGETEFRFTPTVPGTYSYGGERLSPGPQGDISLPGRTEADRALRGLLIVDPPGEAPDPDERFFLITHWGDEDLPASFLPATRFFINGRSWPHTERLTYAQGDTVRWRVMNFTGRPHPMHLHGFYFHVDARGDLFHERVFAPEERRAAVTEVLEPAETMRMSWVATEPGNWIFHCHFMRHMSWVQTAPIDGPPPAHAHEGPHSALEGEDLMGGLVLGVTVLPDAGHRPAADGVRRRLELFINERDGVFGDEPAYAFVLGDGASRPAADSVRFPGSPLMLTRGEPTEIVVHNQSHVPLGVHWHGLELESWADGVPGWSGLAGSVVPAIAPGDSLAVRMTPPRAGTFMYHVHSEPGHQLAQGLYGPFLVLEEGEAWDPERDRLFLLGSLGTGDDPPPAVNGRLEPGPEAFRAGETYRLRFMHISPDDDKRVSLLRDGEPVSWRHVAKDGADLPPNQVTEQPAELHIHVGETYDFQWEPTAPGDYTLRVVTVFDQGAPIFPRNAPPPDTLDIPVTVEGVGARAPALDSEGRDRGLENVGPEADSRYEAAIRRTAYGVAHIEAADLASLGFGEGYAQAEDHLCTIADQVVHARGERAKYFGRGENDAHLNSDIAVRAVRIHEGAVELLAAEPPEIQGWVEGFAAGYNRYLAETGADAVSGWCRGEPWVQAISAADIPAIQRLNFGVVSAPVLFAGVTPPTEATRSGAASASDPADTAASMAFDLPVSPPGASNGWALGREMTESGRGMLLAQPHYAWIGSNRFWEKHLRIPGELDVYGMHLVGHPGVIIGFNEHLGWTHTVPAGSRFTLYAVDLIPGQATRYRFGDEERDMTSREVAIEVRGEPEPVRRTLWSTHHGPLIAPGGPLQWTAERAYALRDANHDNGALLRHVLATGRAGSMQAFQDAHGEHQGLPWLNTIAASADGVAWYADGSATPHIGPAALAEWRQRREMDPVTAQLWQGGVVLLDGSDPAADWVDDPDARHPGVVPFREAPQLERTDYVFNANDSYWLVHADTLLEAGISPLYGRVRSPLSPRSRSNAMHLTNATPDRPAGEDGRFNLREVQEAALGNRSLTGDMLVPDLVARCRATPSVALDGEPLDLTAACDVLAGWDRRFDLDSRGAVLFREWITRYGPEELLRAGTLFAVDFDPDDPVRTPRTLAPGPLALENLGRAVALLKAREIPLDTPLGELQYAPSKLPRRMPVHGAGHWEGVLNLMLDGTGATTLEPIELAPPVEGSRFLTEAGYPVLHGTSFLMALEFTDDGPRAEAILTYGQSGDPESEHFTDQTELFARKEWRPVLFRPEDVAAGTRREYTVVGEGGAAGAGSGYAPADSATAVPEPVGRPPGPEEPTSTGRSP